MSEVVDILQKKKNHTLDFELPIFVWDTLKEETKEIISSGWGSIKYLNEEGDAVNKDIKKVPNDCGGIYIFLLKPDIIEDLHRYILYIGRARRCSSFNLRKRCMTYIHEKTRPEVANMIETWGKKLFLYY